MSAPTAKCYSTNDEDFCYDDAGDALDHLHASGELEVGRLYYEADCCPIVEGDFDRTEHLLEMLDEDLYELVGEYADNEFTDASKEAKDELTAFITNWIKANVKLGRFFKIIGPSRPVAVTEEDVREFEEPTP